MLIVVMGVSGSGKTSVGQLLAEELNLPFFDADDFHPASNREKMAKGIPLNDEDRWPWLQILADLLLVQEKGKGAVLACSALKESYRSFMGQSVLSSINWVLLEGSKDLIMQRMQERTGHFMPPSLLDSQFQTLERPDYAFHISIEKSLKEIVEEIIIQMNATIQNSIGLIGLGVMGGNLALNFRDKGVKIAVYNRQTPTEVDVAKKFEAKHQVAGFDDLPAFVASLASPRKILLMVNAGKPVDDVLSHLLPLLQRGDVIMDGGNSYYNDTTERSKALEAQGILYLGVGVSGGEEGARKGPAIMPGGSKDAYVLMAPFFDLVAAKDSNNKPCSAYMGPDGAGHFVKMVHNGIEYAEMQILAETYAVMRNLMDLAPQKIAEILDQWKHEGEGSFLLEITRDIMLKKEGEDLLLDKIVDAAEQKGTGSWTIKASLELGIPINTIADAVTARVLSSMKPYRVKANAQYASVLNKEKKHEITTATLKSAFKAARLINHITGFEMIKYASEEFNWGLNLGDIARVWTNGCIIRSVLMEQLSTLLTTESQLLLAPQVVKELKETQASLAMVAAQSLQNGLAVPVYTSALNYFLSCITANSAANLIQAQRDYFGAHRYKRVDQDQNLYFHTQWV